MSSNPLTVFIYESEAALISNWTLQYKRIETGGDLFGLWQSESQVVVQAVLGPGKNCKRAQTSFFQDEQYLNDVGGFLTTTEGLCNIGGWHSHHTMNLPGPSTGDAATIWRHLPTPGRFLLLIASIEVKQNVPKVSMTFSLFDSSGGKKQMLSMKLCILNGNSPLRENSSIVQNMSLGAEDRVSNVEYKNQERDSKERKTCEGVRSNCGLVNASNDRQSKKKRSIKGGGELLHFEKTADGRREVGGFVPVSQPGSGGHMYPRQRFGRDEQQYVYAYVCRQCRRDVSCCECRHHDDRSRHHSDDDCCCCSIL